ncbi:unnamed protein product [Medioppia subpectinata]|uniref:histone acetyltransferase n=1 Tax=Medioppia subpectinata TaxID=1979941 RepID=A0A7R9LN30_9ACAR|nr:unnamed protein product [Medioppia subpectinata]CAG2120233.1 unnamed protein product [Medioppia subpectinata]
MLNESGDSTSDGISIHTCRTCETRILGIRYHCGQCDHFDLCVACYQRDGHTHAMDQLILIGQWVEVATVANGQSPRQAIQRCAQTLAHSCRCRDANCALPSCHKYKKVAQHFARHCRRVAANRLKLANQKAAAAPAGGGSCALCKQLVVLCCYHAKHCTDSECPVLYCTYIKSKLRQRQRGQRLQRVHILMARIASMARMSAQLSRQQQSPVCFVTL